MFIMKKGRGCKFVVDVGEALCWFVCAQKVHLQNSLQNCACYLSRPKGQKLVPPCIEDDRRDKQTAWTTRFGRKRERKKKEWIYLFPHKFPEISHYLVSKTTKFVGKKSVVLSPSSSLYITKFAKNKNSQFTLDKHKFPEIPQFFGLKNNKICRKKFSGPIIFSYVLVWKLPYNKNI